MDDRMRMDSGECHRWTFWGLAFAFLELALAYCLLCVSALVFLASKFLLVFGLYIPCPCSGILGYENKDICLRQLLFEWPLRIIDTVQKLFRDRLPYEIVCHQEQEEIPSSSAVVSNGKRESNNVLKTGYRKGSSSASGFRIKNSAERESDSDVRMKQTVNQKQKGTGGRRRRGKSSSFLLRGNANLTAADASGSANYTQAMKIENGKGPGALDNVVQDEFSLHGPTNCGDKVNVTDGETDETREHSSPVRALTHNDVDTVKKLERALREERAGRAALVVELEEERAAAATAADEAMAMILRLHADKAALEMEAKQYERMMEERFAYDEEEMTVLKEILVRREKENHFLEKELEAYKQIDEEFSEEGFGGSYDYPFEHCNSMPRDDSSVSRKAQTRESLEKNLAFSNAEAEMSRAEAVMNRQEDGSLPEKELIMYDVHVVEDNTEFQKHNTREDEEKEGPVNTVDYKDKETARMKLMEEIVNQLREIVKDHDDVSSPSSSSVDPSGDLSKSTIKAIRDRV